MKFFRKTSFFFVNYFLIVLSVMSLFRVCLLALTYKSMPDIPTNEVFVSIYETLLRGLKFDVSIVCYILFLPYVIFKLSSFFPSLKKGFFWTFFICLAVLQAFVILIYCSDIPLYLYSGNRITIAAFQWIENPKIVFNMIIEDSFYLIFFIVFQILSIGSNIILYKKVCILFRDSTPYKSIKYNSLVVFFSIVLLFFGSRGNVDGTQLKLKDGIVSDYIVFNQATYNPVFYLLRSYLDKITLMDDNVAAKMASDILKSDRLDISPLARSIKSTQNALHKNVVIVLMESMSANNLAYFGNTESLTPFLDSLTEKSLCFDNCYSSGIHTNNGIFSTLFSFPSFWRVRPMNAYANNNYTGFSTIFKNAGYNTMFFTTQEKNFDNMHQFFNNKCIDKLITQAEYPEDKRVNSFGVADHTQFDKVLNTLSEVSESGKPFFATVLTTSNHPPIVIPTDIPFKPKHSDEIQGVIEYADWSIKMFIEKASKQKWFDSTVFVFLGDHGCNKYNSPYDIYLSFNHIPLLIYSPALFKPKHYTQMTGQIDVFPIVMGLLNFTYTNNTAGVDVINSPRPYIFFSGDDKIGCIDNDYLYVFRQNKVESLYHYRNGDTKDYINELKIKADSMRNYAFALTQTSQWCILNNKTGLK